MCENSTSFFFEIAYSSFCASAATTGAWGYNLNNELQGHQDTTFAYDANGNLTNKTRGTSQTNYIYDVENRLVRVENGSGAAVGNYYYDPFGRRLGKEVDGTRTYFLYSDEGLAGEYDAAGNELRTYGYMPGGTWTTDVLFQKSNGVYYWYRNDQLGTPQKVTTTVGAVVWSGIYDGFGNLQETTTTGFTNNLRMAGQYFDAETGLYYNLNRYYDPTTGRYLRTDPYGDGINLYSYVYNNPQGMIDPLGLCAVRDPHAWLAAAGMIPVLGILPDLADSLLYLIEGDFQNAVFAGLAAIPIAGHLARGVQWSKVGKKLLDPLMNEVGAVTINLRKASKGDLPAVIPEAKNAPIQFTKEGDVFVRYATRADDYRITSGHGISPGTFATTAGDAKNVRSGFGATKRYALPSDKPAMYPFEIRPPAGTPIQSGRVAPAYGKSGGGAEVIFPYGVSDGSVTPLPSIPRR